MSIYDDLRPIAAELFEEFKQGDVRYVPIVVTPGATPDRPASSAPGAPVPINATARPVETKYVNGTSIVVTDKQVTIPNDGKVKPDMSGFIDIDAVRHKVIEIMARPTAGDPIVWTVVVRR